MLSRVSSALQTAADVLAPPASRADDFEYHWKLIQNYYHTHGETKDPRIEDTNIPHHLYQMLQLLVDEEAEQPDAVGPCAERLVGSMRLLDGVSAIARAERPPGARALALSWCTALLRRLRQPLIHHAAVYRPVQRILIQCSESPASPTEKEEVELLLTLCGLVRKQPGLANVFTTPFVEDKTHLLSIPEDVLSIIPVRKVQTPTKNPLFEFNAPPDPIKKVSIISHTKGVSSPRETDNEGHSGSGDDATSCKSQKTVYDDNDKFLLIDLLLSYLNSADNHIVLRACEGIMIVSSLPDADIANLVSGCSSVCESLVHKLADKYKRIPADIDPADVDHLNTSWGYVAQDLGDRLVSKFHGHRELTAFLSWLDYCDTLTKECHANIASHLARTFRQTFLEGTVEGGLGDLHHVVLVTAVVSKCLKVIDSTDLINEISNWLVGDGESPEWPLLHKLINNCLSERYDLSMETLRFFEAIIEKPTEHSLQRLVLCQLSSRGYYAAGARPSAADADLERDRLNALSLQQERDRNRQAMRQLEHEGHVSEQISELLSHEGVATSDAAATPADNIHKVINSFLLLLPKAILSDPVGVDYEQYIHDAHRHYQAWLDITSPFGWAGECGPGTAASSTHSYDSRPEADLPPPAPLAARDASACCTAEDARVDTVGRCGRPASQCFSQQLVLRSRDAGARTPDEEAFDEGPFLRMLLELLGRLPRQPYQINLQLTSIISKLAMLPHPNLHEYLLDPMLPTAQNTRTLFKVLQEVGRQLTMEIPRVKNYAKLIETTRLQLLGEDHAYDENKSHPAVVARWRDANAAEEKKKTSEEHNQLFESLIVLEEFCKELAAIAFVKYQHRLHTDR